MGIYLHIPFCLQKCYYCDFHSIVVKNRARFASVAGSYLVSLRREMLLYLEKLGEFGASSIYFGGGTPTALAPEQLAELVSFAVGQLSAHSELEITVEANPHSLSKQGAAMLSAAGVNRISLGAQAFQDPLLRRLGRLHTAAQIERVVQLLKAAGIENISLDLLFGLPGQTLEQWIETLDRAVALVPTHLSCYSLIVEEDTPFAAWRGAGILDLPHDDLQADMYAAAREHLQAQGYEQYEISNFALPGWESRHNLLYWQNKPFLGLGSGATGYLEGVRYTNVAHVPYYIESLKRGILPVEIKERMGREQEMDETMMVGLRLLQGVSEADFQKRYQVSFWDVYAREIQGLLLRGLLEYAAGYLRVTERGLFLENLVSAAFLR